MYIYIQNRQENMHNIVHIQSNLSTTESADYVQHNNQGFHCNQDMTKFHEDLIKAVLT